MSSLIDNIAKDYAEDALAEARRELGEEADADELRELAGEYLWQSVDGCAEVIYYSKAWEVVGSDPDHCQQSAEDVGLGADSLYASQGLDGMISGLAFAGIYRSGYDFIGEEI